MSSSISAGGLPSAPGGPSPAGTFSSPTDKPKAHAALYVDGFNLYHSLKELGQSHLKWLDLWALGLALINKRQEQLECVKWCTARWHFDPGPRSRHDAYRAALESRGVTALLGHFVQESNECRLCKRDYWTNAEKQGDVNVAIHLIGDAFQRKYHNYYLLSADSDQAATAIYFRATFPTLRIILVSPPGRRHSQHVLKHVTGHRAIDRLTVERCLFGANVYQGKDLVCKRPKEYDPPPGWTPPPW